MSSSQPTPPSFPSPIDASVLSFPVALLSLIAAFAFVTLKRLKEDPSAAMSRHANTSSHPILRRKNYENDRAIEIDDRATVTVKHLEEDPSTTMFRHANTSSHPLLGLNNYENDRAIETDNRATSGMEYRKAGDLRRVDEYGWSANGRQWKAMDGEGMENERGSNADARGIEEGFMNASGIGKSGMKMNGTQWKAMDGEGMENERGSNASGMDASGIEEGFMNTSGKSDMKMSASRMNLNASGIEKGFQDGRNVEKEQGLRARFMGDKQALEDAYELQKEFTHVSGRKGESNAIRIKAENEEVNSSKFSDSNSLEATTLLDKENGFNAENSLDIARLEALTELTTKLSWDAAIELIRVGLGSRDLVLKAIPMLLDVFAKQKHVDAETFAERALESNTMKDLQAAAKCQDVNGPNVIRVKTRLAVMQLDRKLRDAADIEDEVTLRTVLQEARFFVSDVEQVSSESFIAAEAALVRAVTNVASLLHADDQQVDVEQLRESLSHEMWAWDMTSYDSLTDYAAHPLHQGLHLLAALDTRKELREALECGDPDVLSEALIRAHGKRLDIDSVPELSTVEPLVGLQGAYAAMNDVLAKATTCLNPSNESADFDIVRVLELAEAAGVPPCQDPSANQSDLFLHSSSFTVVQVELEKCIQVVFELTRIKHEREMNRALHDALHLTKNQVAELRAALQTSRKLMQRGWVVETPLVRRADSALRKATALELLRVSCCGDVDKDEKNDDLRDRLFCLAGALDVAERNGAGKKPTDERGINVFMQAKTENIDLLNRLMREEALSNPEHRRKILDMGVEYIDDLALLGEGDLRQAGVPRIMVRKILPRLHALGAEAAKHVTKAHVDFERFVREGV